MEGRVVECTVTILRRLQESGSGKERGRDSPPAVSEGGVMSPRLETITSLSCLYEGDMYVGWKSE